MYPEDLKNGQVFHNLPTLKSRWGQGSVKIRDES